MLRPSTPAEFAAVLRRFYDFYDAVIRSVTLQFVERGVRVVLIEIAARDSEAVENDGWASVRITMRNVAEFGVREGPRTPIQVLSQGIHLMTFDGLVGLEFGGAVDAPTGIDELRASDAYAVGESLEIQTGPY